MDQSDLMDKTGLCHFSSRGLVLVWVTHVLLDCLNLHGFPHFLTNQVQIPDIRGASGIGEASTNACPPVRSTLADTV